LGERAAFGAWSRLKAAQALRSAHGERTHGNDVKRKWSPVRIPVIAGNWKMHKTVSETSAFIQAVKGKIESDGVESVICAPFTSLPALTEAAEGTNVKIGAQNMHWEESGAYTGEISGAMLRELGVDYVIIGHSERRAYFAETNETVNKKVHAAFQSGLIPIVCVGETLAEREAGRTMDIVKTQTVAAFAGLSGEQAAKVLVAYEPVWAIGTGKSSTAEDAEEVIRAIRGELAAAFGSAVADQVRILYGGSVKPDNIRFFLEQPDIDGALVGGASLDPESFIQLVKGAK
jgi:triosephosphate isomerase